MNKKGFALLEVMIAALIISLSVIGGLELTTYLLRTSAKSKQYIQALNIAESQIALFSGYSTMTYTTQNLFYDYMTGLNGTSITASACGTLATPTSCAGDNTQYTVSFFVNYLLTPSPYLFVDVIVNWTDSQNNTDKVELSSIITRIDPILKGQTIL